MPLMSIEAHGQIARGIIFATNFWGQYIKFSPTKRDPATSAQKYVRQIYGEIAGLWRLMNTAERAVYHTEAVRNRRTDYNEFFHQKWPEMYLP